MGLADLYNICVDCDKSEHWLLCQTDNYGPHLSLQTPSRLLTVSFKTEEILCPVWVVRSDWDCGTVCQCVGTSQHWRATESRREQEQTDYVKFLHNVLCVWLLRTPHTGLGEVGWCQAWQSPGNYNLMIWWAPSPPSPLQINVSSGKWCQTDQYLIVISLNCSSIIWDKTWAELHREYRKRTKCDFTFAWREFPVKLYLRNVNQPGIWGLINFHFQNQISTIHGLCTVKIRSTKLNLRLWHVGVNDYVLLSMNGTKRIKWVPKYLCENME